MEFVTLVAGLLLPWLCGSALMLALRSARTPLAAPGEIAWLCGTGYLVGAFVLTLWMRALSSGGIAFGVLVIAAPLAAATALAMAVAGRRHGRDLVSAPVAALRALAATPGLTGAMRTVWWAALGWLAFRYALLAAEVALRPLYPWDAWIQWATKARVWYELGGVTPFARAHEWLAAGGSVYFDASPEYPPTMPLLQVWSCLLVGRWDDVMMNWPWWQIAVALPLVAYGALRNAGAGAPSALAGAFLVATLPLANVHVALAGYADLPMAAYYAAAALALLRWGASRDARDAVLALVLAVACTQIKTPGFFWALTLVPGAIVVFAPSRGPRVVAAGFGAMLLVLFALASQQATIFNYRLNLDFDPATLALAQSFFALGNWHILWYGAVVATLLARRRLLGPALAPLTMIVAGGAIFLLVVFSFSNARDWVDNQTSINRAVLHIAPLIAVFTVLAYRAFASRWREWCDGTPSRPQPG